MSESSQISIAKVAAGAAVVASTAALAYYLLKKDSQPHGQKEVRDFNKAKQLKELGVAQFSKANYADAIKLFEESAEILKSLLISPEQQDFLSTIYNNLSAATEYQGDVDKSLAYTDDALNIKKDYAKVYARRARLFRTKENFEMAVRNSGCALKLMVESNDKTSSKINSEFIQDLQKLTELYAETFYNSIITSSEFYPISRITTSEWTQKIAIHDPLLERLESISGSEDDYRNNLDKALFYFKNGQFDKVLEPALEASFEHSVIDRLLARLLAARVYYFAALNSEARYMNDTFTELWDEQPEEFKAENRNLLFAQWCFQIYLDEMAVSEQKITQNLALCEGNADPVVVLANFLSRFNELDKALDLLKEAKKLEPERRDIEFFNVYFSFYDALRKQDVSLIPQAGLAIDRYISSHELPEYQVVNFAKVYAAMGNLDLALEILIKYKEKFEGSIVFDLFYALTVTEKNSTNLEAIKNFTEAVAAMSRHDPYNHEVLSILSRSLNESKKYQESANMALLALRCVRNPQEFAIRFQDVVAAFAFADKDFSIETITSYKGPVYPKASVEYDNKFKESHQQVV